MEINNRMKEFQEKVAELNSQYCIRRLQEFREAAIEILDLRMISVEKLNN
jgi:hypothetical protein